MHARPVAETGAHHDGPPKNQRDAVSAAREGAQREPADGCQHSKSRYYAGLAGILACAALFSWLAFTAYNERRPGDASRCRMAYMSPGYIRQSGLDASRSDLAEKYSLWLYREQGWDLSNTPHGTPVLFAPGNAGSYRQARSLAAAAARQYYESPGNPNAYYASRQVQELDFFAADFNEDFSAFHAGTLEEQARYLADCVQYILEQYSGQGSSAPTSVILIAHSMGGISARYMFLQPRFAHGSVETLITLSTPHMVPPATFDRGVERIYSKINTFWKDAYMQTGSMLEQVMMVSIAGGIADVMVSSDYADISSLVPAGNGFSVLTTTVPPLYSPVDHLAMMWCDQLRHQVAAALLLGSHANIPSRARPLQERLAIMQDHLLTGLEMRPTPLIPASAAGVTMHEADVKDARDHLLLSGTEEIASQVYLVHSELFNSDRSKALQVQVSGAGVEIEYLSCTTNPSSSIYDCQTLAKPQYASLPRNLAPAGQSDTAQPELLYTELSVPREDEVGLFRITKPLGSVVSICAASETPATVKVSLLRLLLYGWSTASNASSCSILAYHFPSLDTSLLVYRLHVAQEQCSSPDELVVRAYTTGMHESRFFSGKAISTSLHLHTAPPYVASGSEDKGLHLQLWRMKYQCTTSIRLHIDWKASLGTLVLRYRSLISSWPTIFLLAVLRRQLLYAPAPQDPAGEAIYATQMGAFEGGIAGCVLADLGNLVTIATSANLVQVVLLHWGIAKDMLSSLLLGTKEALLVPLTPLFLLVAMAIFVLLHTVLRCLLAVVHVLGSSLTGMVNRGRPGALPPPEGRPRTRIAAFGTLAAFVTLFAPHQFAFLALFLVHADTTLRSYKAKANSPAHWESNYTVLLAMLLLLPQNAAILLVWLRNLQAGWWQPFPSDHNILAITGVFLLVEHLRSGRLTLPCNVYIRQATNVVLLASMSGVLLWGIRYNFVVGESMNIVFAWLAVLQYKSVRQFL